MKGRNWRRIHRKNRRVTVENGWQEGPERVWETDFHIPESTIGTSNYQTRKMTIRN
jgi:hypothetical protein